jgi:hypothetical protein
MSIKTFRHSIPFLILLLAAGSVLALPADRVLVVEASLIEGLADYHGEIVVSESSVFDVEDGSYRIDGDALASLDGLRVLFLIDRREDRQRGDTLERKHWQEVRSLRDDYFELDLIGEEPFWYQVAEVDGQLGLMGQGNLLRAEGGDGEPFQVWRIDGLRTVAVADLQIR